MPIFGGSPHRWMNVRLRDEDKPISVLTGTDNYLVHHLMCQVPEVAMCWHFKNQLIRTGDIPFMEDSVMQDVALDIYPFLKSKFTRAGHTYWLQRSNEKDCDVVKLYDLTSLCAGNKLDNAPNPFTIHFALLLYCAAKNMKYSLRVQSSTTLSTIRMLLKNCMKVFSQERYPVILTSAQYMFVDSLIPIGTDPSDPKFEKNIFDDQRDIGVQPRNQDNDEKSHTHRKTSRRSKKELQLLLSIRQEDETFARLLRDNEEVEILDSLEKRCETALEHIASGLSCLKYFKNSNDEVEILRSLEKCCKFEKEEKPYEASLPEPIPMPYKSVRNGNKTSESDDAEKHKNAHEKKSTGTLICKSRSQSVGAWKQHLKTLLIEKACLVYATLAEHEYSEKRFGSALKHLRLVLECRAHLENAICTVQRSAGKNTLSYLSGRAGDCYLQMSLDWDLIDQHRNDFSAVSNVEKSILKGMERKGSEAVLDYLFIPSDKKMTMEHSYKCYLKAVELESREEDRNNLQRRVGCICNELGSFYMKQARGISESQSNPETSKSTVEALFAISQRHLENGIKAFKLVNDQINLALLYSNKGRLMRLLAFHHTENDHSLNEVSKGFYNKALSNYEMALTVLKNRHIEPEIWDTIYFEMSSAQYTFASHLQDHPPQINVVGRNELKREVFDRLLKALTFCDMETPGPNQPKYQYRVADIHHRLAKLHYFTYRNLVEDSKKRSKILLLCNNHFEKAIELFEKLEKPTNALRARLERIELYKTISNDSKNVTAKIKNLQIAIELILESSCIFKVICDRTSCQNGAVVDDYLLQLMEKLFTFILRSLIKYCSASSKYCNMVTKLKKMYGLLLRSSIEEETPIAERLYRVINRYKDAFK